MSFDANEGAFWDPLLLLLQQKLQYISDGITFIFYSYLSYFSMFLYIQREGTALVSSIYHRFYISKAGFNLLTLFLSVFVIIALLISSVSQVTFWGKKKIFLPLYVLLIERFGPNYTKTSFAFQLMGH